MAIATVTATRMIVAITGLSALLLLSSLRVFNWFDPLLVYRYRWSHLNLVSLDIRLTILKEAAK